MRAEAEVVLLATVSAETNISKGIPMKTNRITEEN
jgi:hypothetical protein